MNRPLSILVGAMEERGLRRSQISQGAVNVYESEINRRLNELESDFRTWAHCSVDAQIRRVGDIRLIREQRVMLMDRDVKAGKGMHRHVI